MSLQHIQKNSPRLLPKPAKFEKNPPNGYRVIRKTKCGAGGAGGAAGAGGAGGARSSPIHKQASLAGRLMSKHAQSWQFFEEFKPFFDRKSFNAATFHILNLSIVISVTLLHFEYLHHSIQCILIKY